MEKLFSDFTKVSKKQWEEKLTIELKGADFESSLKRQDEIEGINYSTYTHVDELSEAQKTKLPDSHFTKTQNNDWHIGSLVLVLNEKEANNKALSLLMKGASSIFFEINKAQIDWTNLFHEIGLEHIEVHFLLKHPHQYTELRNYFNARKNCTVFYRLDLLNDSAISAYFSLLTEENKSTQTRFCHVNGFGIQQSGANTSQEIAFSLAEGHEYLVKLMEFGLDIDQAASCIHFSLGVGSNYFFELSKMRAFRELWAHLISAYHPEHKHSLNALLTAEIGHLNKSLNDPYTNLLRQTTEGMSAVSGGIDTLLIHPYDSKSTQGSSEFTERLAINTSLIMKEESYFDKVIDPTGGSYSIEKLTGQISQKAWAYFQQIDAAGGLLKQQGATLLRDDVAKTSHIRKEYIKQGTQLLIGINKYPNPEQESNSWLEKETFFGIPQLILERDI
jgi:methylmalonyl-CoA mutase